MISNPNKVVIVDPSTSATIEIMQPITQVVEVVTGPLGLKGDAGAPGEPGPQGPAGFSIFSEAGANTFATTSSLQITGSVTISGSSTFTNIGPAVFTGTVTVSNTIVANIISGTFSGSGAGLVNIPAGAVTGLSTSAITSESYSASISENGLQINTNVVALSFTGSLFGTASWANNVNSSSYALTSSYAQNVLSASYAVTASYFSGTVQNAQTASYVLNAVSSSYATTASYIDPTSLGGLILLSTATANNSATIDFTIDTTIQWATLLLIGTNITTANDGVSYYIRTGYGSTPTYNTGGSDYNYGYRGAFNLNFTTAAQIEIARSADQAVGSSFVMNITNPSLNAVRKGILWQAQVFDSAITNAIYDFVGVGAVISNNEPYSAIRFFASSGNISTGTFKLYGLK